ncbi:MAG: hypothetical protein HRT37_09560 [Alteromonadaceae bacterium]|nr:hypothetical protein [Alteromonadaceae bacterium]
MKIATKLIALTLSLLVSACSSTSENVSAELEKVDPRQGEAVTQVCKISGWGQIEGDGNVLLIYNYRREAFKLSMVGFCDADWAMSHILIDGKGGANCVARGSKITTDANFSRGGSCTVMKIHKWLSLATPTDLE